MSGGGHTLTVFYIKFIFSYIKESTPVTMVSIKKKGYKKALTAVYEVLFLELKYLSNLLTDK